MYLSFKIIIFNNKSFFSLKKNNKYFFLSKKLN